MIPADLLDQLRETDEELFLKVIGGFPLKNGKYLSILGMKPPAAHAWLQHCLQEAIRARGWHISQSVTCWGREQPYYAAIRKSEYEPWAGETGDTEAEALMRAYLSALSCEAYLAAYDRD